MNPIFDHNKLTHNRQRAAKKFSAYNVLHKHIAALFADRLNDINRIFENATIMGDIGIDLFLNNTEITKKLKITQRIQAKETQHYNTLNLDRNSIDCALSFMHMHNINDLPGFLAQVQRALKPDGLFLGCFIGGESLYELRQSFYAAETQIYGGASPHIHPFIDKQQIGALLQRTGFALPAIDSEIIKFSHKDIYTLIQDIRGIGEGIALYQTSHRYYPKAFFDTVNEHHHKAFPDPKASERIETSVEVVFVLGWAPSPTQQQPMKPGSAEKSLIDALNPNQVKDTHNS